MATWTDIPRRAIRGIVPFALYKRLATWYTDRVTSRALGAKQFAALQQLKSSSGHGDPVAFQISGVATPVWARPGTTDAWVLEDVLLRSMYACEAPATPPRLILDAGANAGYASLFFLNRFPDATVVSFEPDSANHALVKRNVQPYGDRAVVHKAAIWPTDSKLRVQPCERADGITVVPVNEGEPFDCIGRDPLSVLRESGRERIDIFKCDIEGGEEILFSTNPDPWIERTGMIMMEIHSPRAHEIVYSAMAHHPFRAARYRELHIFSRSR